MPLEAPLSVLQRMLLLRGSRSASTSPTALTGGLGSRQDVRAMLVDRWLLTGSCGASSTTTSPRTGGTPRSETHAHRRQPWSHHPQLQLLAEYFAAHGTTSAGAMDGRLHATTAAQPSSSSSSSQLLLAPGDPPCGAMDGALWSLLISSIRNATAVAATGRNDGIAVDDLLSHMLRYTMQRAHRRSDRSTAPPHPERSEEVGQQWGIHPLGGGGGMDRATCVALLDAMLVICRNQCRRLLLHSRPTCTSSSPRCVAHDDSNATIASGWDDGSLPSDIGGWSMEVLQRLLHPQHDARQPTIAESTSSTADTRRCGRGQPVARHDGGVEAARVHAVCRVASDVIRMQPSNAAALAAFHMWMDWAEEDPLRSATTERSILSSPTSSRWSGDGDEGSVQPLEPRDTPIVALYERYTVNDGTDTTGVASTAALRRAMTRWATAANHPIALDPSSNTVSRHTVSTGVVGDIPPRSQSLLAVLLYQTPEAWAVLSEGIAAHVAAAQQLQRLQCPPQHRLNEGTTPGAPNTTTRQLLIALTRVGYVLPPTVQLGMMDVAALLSALGVEAAGAKKRASLNTTTSERTANDHRSSPATAVAAHRDVLFSPGTVWKASMHLPAHQRRAVVAHVLVYLLQRGVLVHSGLSVEDVCVAVGNVRWALSDMAASFRGLPLATTGAPCWADLSMVSAVMDCCRPLFLDDSRSGGIASASGPGNAGGGLLALIAQHLLSIWGALLFGAADGVASEGTAAAGPSSLPPMVLAAQQRMHQQFHPLIEAASRYARQWLPNGAVHPQHRSGAVAARLLLLLPDDVSVDAARATVDGLSDDELGELLYTMECQLRYSPRHREGHATQHMPPAAPTSSAIALLEAMVLRLEPHVRGGTRGAPSMVAARLLLRVLHVCADHAPHLLRHYHTTFESAHVALTSPSLDAAASVDGTPPLHPVNQTASLQQPTPPSSIDVLLQRQWSAALRLFANATARTQRRTALFVLRSTLDDADGMDALLSTAAVDGAGSSSLSALVHLAAEGCRLRGEGGHAASPGPAGVLHQVLERVAAASLRSGAWHLGMECHAIAIRVHPQLGLQTSETLRAYLRELSRMQARKALLTHMCAAVCHAVKRSLWHTAIEALLAMDQEDRAAAGRITPRLAGSTMTAMVSVTSSAVDHRYDDGRTAEATADADGLLPYASSGWWWRRYIAGNGTTACPTSSEGTDMVGIVRALRYAAMAAALVETDAHARSPRTADNRHAAQPTDGGASRWATALAMLAPTVHVLPLSAAEAAMLVRSDPTTLTAKHDDHHDPTATARPNVALGGAGPPRGDGVPAASPLEYAMLFRPGGGDDPVPPQPGVAVRDTALPPLQDARHRNPLPLGNVVPLYPQEQAAVHALFAFKRDGDWAAAVGLLERRTGWGRGAPADPTASRTKEASVPWRFTHLALAACNAAGQWAVALRAHALLRRRMRVAMPSTVTREALLACHAGRKWEVALSIFVSASGGERGSAIALDATPIGSVIGRDSTTAPACSSSGNRSGKHRVLLQATARNACIVMDTLIGCGALSVACVVARHVAHLRDPYLVDVVLEAFAASSMWNDSVDYFFHAVGRHGVRVRDKSIALAMAACHEVRATQQLHDQHLARSVASMASALEDLCCVSGAILEHVLFVYHRQGTGVGGATLYLGAAGGVVPGLVSQEEAHHYHHRRPHHHQTFDDS